MDQNLVRPSWSWTAGPNWYSRVLGLDFQKDLKKLDRNSKSLFRTFSPDHGPDRKKSDWLFRTKIRTADMFKDTFKLGPKFGPTNSDRYGFSVRSDRPFSWSKVIEKRFKIMNNWKRPVHPTGSSAINRKSDRWFRVRKFMAHSYLDNVIFSTI